jgi:hypothetical protein
MTGIKGWVGALAAVAIAAGCAGIPLTESNTTLVTAKKIIRAGGAAPSELTDAFTLDGPIVAFLTFKWDQTAVDGGFHRIEIRWFNGDKEISRRTHEATFGKPPHYVWFTTSGVAIGPGRARADVYVDGKRVATRTFVVTEK